MKTYIAWLQPRDYSHAGRVVSVLLLVAAAVTASFASIQLVVGGTATGQGAVLVAMLGVAAIAIPARRWTDHHRWAWAAVPMGAVPAIIGMDYLSSDASVAAQVFLFFPALYGASELRREGSFLVGAACLAGEGALVFARLDFVTALTEFIYVGAALVTTSMLLTRANQDKAELIAMLTRQAAIDPLTGLVTRRVLDEAAHSALAGAAAGGTGLILLDVDNFKAVNDQHGHLTGDDVLVHLSRLLIAHAGTDDVVSRLGGDEIAVLMPGCSAEQLSRRSLTLVEQVREHHFHLADGRRLEVTVSAGIAHSPTHGVGLRELYAAADTGLYAAKRAGRNRVHPPGSSLHQPSRPSRSHPA